MMKRIIYYFVVLFCLLGSGLWKAQASYCTQPTSYRFTSNANGTWGSTWTNNSSAAANTYLITHRVEYTSALKPASGTIIVVKNGGELVLNQLQTDNGGVTIILDGGKLTVTQNIQLEKSDDRICAINGNCITVGENFQIKSSSQLYIANSGIKVVNGNLENNSGGSIYGEHIKVWVKQNFYNGSWSSSTVDAWYAGGTNPSWSGESSSSMVPCTPPCIIPAKPDVTVTNPTCSAPGTATINPYNSAYIYTFSPSGPTVGRGGVISGMTVGQSYTVTATNGACISVASSSFSIAAATGNPAAPATTVNSTATCSLNSTVKITGYNATNTYNISPAGTTIDASEVISGTAGNYTITVTTGGCTSSSSSFSIVAATGGPAAPVVSTNNLTNICSATTANLTTIQPAAVIGQSYQWHTAASNPTPLTLVIDPAAVPAGIYYLYIKLNNGTCYSTASGAVTVTTTNCSGCEDELLNLSSFEGQTNTQNIFATNNIAIGTNRLGLTHNASLPGNFSLNVISQTHYPGEFGIQIGHNKADGLTPAQRIESQITFTTPIKNLKFTINDLDLGDNVIVNAYDASNNLIAIQPYNYFIHNTANISRVGNRFYPPDPNFASPNGSREGTVDFNFNGQYVTRVVFQFYDTEFTGSYSISKITAEACESGCVQPGSTVIGGTPTKVGITIQEKNDKWPESVPNGFIALESKTKGFVITRVANSGVVVEAKEGMLIYDIAAKCVKLYNGTIWNCLAKSCNE